MSVFNPFSSIFSPSWKSMARLVFPSRLELKRPEGSFRAAPLAKVIFTTFLYVSPVQIRPSCDHTGTPLHFHSSTTSGSASLTKARSRPSILPRQSPSSLILASISRDGDLAFSKAVFFMLAAPACCAPDRASLACRRSRIIQQGSDQFRDIRAEGETTDERRADCADQHGAGRDVLDAANALVRSGRNQVADLLDRGVERFRRPDPDQGGDDPSPIRDLDPQRQAGADHGTRCRQVKPGVVLAAQQEPQPPPRVLEAA